MTSALLTDLPVAGSATSSLGVRGSESAAAYLDRALPQKDVDLISDGVSRKELVAGQADKLIYGALFRIAAGACQRGWNYAEWSGLVLRPASMLGQQLRLRGGVRARPEAQVHKTLQKAWDGAVTWVATRPPPWGPADIRAHLGLVVAMVEDPTNALSDDERCVLAHFATVGTTNGTTTPTLARAPFLAATGLGLTAWRTVMARLEAAGVLLVHTKGRPAGPSSRKRLATVYRLGELDAVDAYLYRGTRSVVPQSQTCGAPLIGAPSQTCGAPRARPGAADDRKDQLSMNIPPYSSTLAPPSPPAGWYDDPDNAKLCRYWNGGGWTASRKDKVTVAIDVPRALVPQVRALMTAGRPAGGGA